MLDSNDRELQQALAEFVGAFEVVFRYDWPYTKGMIVTRSVPEDQIRAHHLAEFLRIASRCGSQTRAPIYWMMFEQHALNAQLFSQLSSRLTPLRYGSGNVLHAGLREPDPVTWLSDWEQPSLNPGRIWIPGRSRNAVGKWLIRLTD